MLESANHFDSLPGARLSQNKVLSNQLVERLGFPGVVHGVADSTQAAIGLARSIGFPVVVKPINAGKGTGVTANITTEGELARAFDVANGVSPGAVIVERHVAGDDHRIVVLGGKLTWTIQRLPPRVVGDGRHTISELIEIENRARSDAGAESDLTQLSIDADMRAQLEKQGFSPDDRPPEGSRVTLRSIAGSPTGGTFVGCSTDIHPDNRDMAEAIARGFHLDAVGIDFMTCDIGTSWRQGECAVLEVNSTIGCGTYTYAELVLQSKFPPGSDGRVPSAVLVGADAPVMERVTNRLGANGMNVGQTNAEVTLLGGTPRFSPGHTLPSRVIGLLLDPCCDALVIAATPAEIEQHGFPLDRCDVALILASTWITEPIRRLIESCAATVIDGVTEENMEAEVMPGVITGMLRN